MWKSLQSLSNKLSFIIGTKGCKFSLFCSMQIVYCSCQKFSTSAFANNLGSFQEEDRSHLQVIDKCCEPQAQIN